MGRKKQPTRSPSSHQLQLLDLLVLGRCLGEGDVHEHDLVEAEAVFVLDPVDDLRGDLARCQAIHVQPCFVELFLPYRQAYLEQHAAVCERCVVEGEEERTTSSHGVVLSASSCRD